ncbi:MAG: methylaspartate mutase [Ramlibacter sp.]|nr:methylaspartate mutase [Ramlibacter sp.]
MAGHFQSFIKQARREGRLVVQPRMGFGRIEEMGAGLAAVAALPCTAIGTITLDSYTRVGDYLSPLDNLARGDKLNGFPIVSKSLESVRTMLAPFHQANFPIQVRHGTARPQEVFRRLVEVGLEATEGGPVSYCLPYSRVSLREAVLAWEASCHILAGGSRHGHIESFGGCMLGQLCPPSMLLAITLLEALFFVRHGVESVSLSYAQGTLAAQDLGALRALRELAAQYLAGTEWHVVVYTYMGVFPGTAQGASALIRDSARLARRAGCERLIVKTVTESRQIPTVQDNLDALMRAAQAASDVEPGHDPSSQPYYEEISQEARALVDAALNLDPDPGKALVRAFERGLLDVPYCLHADNPGKATTRIDSAGALRWASTGALPLPRSSGDNGRANASTSAELLKMLGYLSNRYDQHLQ